MPLCGLLLQCARDNLGAFSIHVDVVDPFKVYRAAGGPGSDRVRKMDLGVARSRPRPFLFLAPLLLGAAPGGFSAAGDVGVVSFGVVSGRCHGHVHVWFHELHCHCVTVI